MPVITSRELPELFKSIFEGDNPTVIVDQPPPECEPLQFQNPEELLEHFDSVVLPKRFMMYAIRYESMEGTLQRTRIELAKETGYRFRVMAEGWGVIRLHLKVKEGENIEAHFAVNSELRAYAYESTYKGILPASDWNWAMVRRHQARLDRRLKKLAKSANSL